MNLRLSFCQILLCFLSCQLYLPVQTQRTSLDDIFGAVYRPFRLLGLQITGRSGDDPRNVELVREMGVSKDFNLFETQHFAIFVIAIFIAHAKVQPTRTFHTQILRYRKWTRETQRHTA